MKRYLLLTPVLAAGSWMILSTFSAAVPPEPATPKISEPNLLKFPSRKDAMLMKLKSSQSILEGIALNDFAMIETAANQMISVSNYTDFLHAFKGNEYEFHIQTFRRPAETIAKKAKAKNIDGVMVAFNDLTLSCLKCHQAMRDDRFERTQRPGEPHP